MRPATRSSPRSPSPPHSSLSPRTPRARAKSLGSERKVAILLYEGVELLDFAGPGEVFAAAGDFEVFTVAPTSAPVVSQGFVEVQPRYSLASAPRPTSW